MVDVFAPDKRSEIMSRVKQKNTKPEIVVRSILHRLGYRFRLHKKGLPGKPDIVLARHKKVIFVNGCFWHGHRRCRKGSLPETNKTFWKEKIGKNRKRDRRVKRELRNAGWGTLTVWECQTRDLDKIASLLEEFMSENRKR